VFAVAKKGHMRRKEIKPTAKPKTATAIEAQVVGG
jgi:hypothetical protein